jgi:nitrate reductase cytochrome c-type subunit
MKTSMVVLAILSLVATAATANALKITDQETVRCARNVMKDPDANVRGEFTRNCAPMSATRQPPVTIPHSHYQRRERVYSDDMWMG